MGFILIGTLLLLAALYTAFQFGRIDALISEIVAIIEKR